MYYPILSYNDLKREFCRMEFRKWRFLLKNSISYSILQSYNISYKQHNFNK